MATIANIFALKLDDKDFNSQIEKASKLSKERSDQLAASLLKAAQLEQQRIGLLERRSVAQAAGDKASITSINQQISATASLITAENRRMAGLKQAGDFLKEYTRQVNEAAKAVEVGVKTEIDSTKRRNEVLSSLSAQRVAEERARFNTISALLAQKSKEAADIEIANAKRRNQVLSSLNAQRASEEKRVADARTQFSQTYESTPQQNRFNESLQKLNSLKAEGIITQEQYSKALEKETAILKEGAPLRDSQFNHMIRMLRWAGTLVGAYYALNAAYDVTIGKGVKVASLYESMEIGISAQIAANSRNVTSMGRSVTAAEKFAMAQKDASDAIIQLRKANIDTPATLVQLTQGFQSALGPAMALGFSIKQTVEYARLMTLAAASMKVPMDMLAEEMRSILSGNISKDSVVATVLGLTNKQIEAHKKLGDTYEFVIGKLRDFSSAGDAVKASWEGISSDMSDAWDAFTADFVESTGIFDGLKSTMKDITGFLKNQNGEMDKVKSYIPVVQGLATTYAVLWGATKAASLWETALDVVRKRSTATTMVYDAVLRREVETTVVLTGAQSALAVASGVLGTAMKMLPFVAVASTVALLTTEFFKAENKSEDLANSLNTTAEALGKLTKAQLEYKRTNLSLELQDVGLQLRQLKQSSGPAKSRNKEDQKEIDDLTDSYNQLLKASVQVASAQQNIGKESGGTGKTGVETLTNKPREVDPAEAEKAAREAEKIAARKAKIAHDSLELQLEGYRLAEQQYFIENDIVDTLAQKQRHGAVTLAQELKATEVRRDAFKSQDDYETAILKIKKDIKATEVDINQGITQRTREYSKQETALRGQIVTIGIMSEDAKTNLTYESNKTELIERYNKLLSDNEELGTRGLELRKQLASVLQLEVEKNEKITEEAKKQAALKLTEAFYQSELSFSKQLDTYRSLTDQAQKNLDIEREIVAAYHQKEQSLLNAGLLGREYADMTQAEKDQADSINRILTNRLVIIEKQKLANNTYIKLATAGVNKLNDNMTSFFDYQSDGWLKTGDLAKGVLDSIYKEALKLMVLDPVSMWTKSLLSGGSGSAVSQFSSMTGGSNLLGAATDAMGFTTTRGGTVFDAAGQITKAGSDNLGGIGDMVSMASNLKTAYTAVTGGLSASIADAFAQGAATIYNITGSSATAGGVGNFGAGLASPWASAGAAGAEGIGALVGSAGLGALGGYAVGSLGDKLFGAETKASTIGAIGGGIGAALGGPVGFALGAALGSVIGGMFGSTKTTGSGYYFNADTQTGSNAMSYTDYKKKSWFSSSSWTTMSALSDVEKAKVKGIFDTYDYLLAQLGVMEKITLKAGKYAGASFQDQIAKNFITTFTGLEQTATVTVNKLIRDVTNRGFKLATVQIQTSAANPEFAKVYAYWTDYAKAMKISVAEALTSQVGSYISTTRSFKEWSLGSGSAAQLKYTADYLANDLKALEDQMGVSGITASNYLAKYEEVLKTSFTPETITQWNSLGEALRGATDAQAKYTEAITSEFLTSVNNSISLLQGIFSSLNATIDTLRGAAGGASYTMSQFRKSMELAMSLKDTANYQGFTDAVQAAASYSGALLDAGNFQTSRDMRFAQSVAANQFEDLGKSALTQIDYLRVIAANTGNLAVASGMPQASLAVGTPNVPYDMNARIHRGEVIVPKTFSDGIRNGDLYMGKTDNSDLISAINSNTRLIGAIIDVLNESRDIQNGSLVKLEYLAEVS